MRGVNAHVPQTERGHRRVGPGQGLHQVSALGGNLHHCFGQRADTTLANGRGDLLRPGPNSSIGSIDPVLVGIRVYWLLGLS
jgi:hypothetical protein